jgi:NAD(P)-dependent dehydrogenase (short-subunit alcohol dehydrogenase family)
MTAPDTTDVPDYASLLRLDGGRYLVLGAGQGIGRQSAHALVANGAQVICVDLDPARVEAVVAELGPAATAWTGDITQAAEFGPLRIRVSAVSPGIIWTPRFAEILGDEGRRTNDENTPLGHIAQPSEIASAILFLASRMSGHITGQVVVVDGGVNAKFPYPAVNMVRK